MDTYANMPQSIAEARSDKTGRSKDWTPRDALIALLREIDAGNIVMEQVIIVFATKVDDELQKTCSRSAGKFTTYECMGLLHDAAWRMHNDGG